MIIDWLRARRGGSARTASLSPAKIEAMKDDLIAAISRHVDIDTKRVEISLTKDRKKQRLVADIPLATRRQRAH
jgi:cell division topological specificity factor MinE